MIKLYKSKQQKLFLNKLLVGTARKLARLIAQPLYQLDMAAPMSSMPRLLTHHAHHAIIGINVFVLLCGIKAFQLLNMQPKPEALKKFCTHWLVEETHLMLNLLITQSSQMRQLASFPQPELGANIIIEIEIEFWNSYMMRNDAKEFVPFCNKE
ncbi:hypothetical protein HD554DRAFT_2037105 [Boletus coccyginus]|nr:hypothetical protein HD554DRAFT_2037105 [Boletus coccyginus]